MPARQQRRADNSFAPADGACQKGDFGYLVCAADSAIMFDERVWLATEQNAVFRVLLHCTHRQSVRTHVWLTVFSLPKEYS
jgi:hypothetical protein